MTRGEGGGLHQVGPPLRELSQPQAGTPSDRLQVRASNLSIGKIMRHRSGVRSLICLIASSFLFFESDGAFADTIPGLFNTGVDDFGSLLTDGITDSHYILVGPPPSIQCPLCSGNAVARATDPAWISPPANSKWIGPVDNNDAPGGVTFEYTLTFDLSGLDPNSAIITGLWSSDNGSLIFLNGVDTGLTNGDFGSEAFRFMTPFQLNGGFTNGLNSLTFIVGNNGGGPTSLLVSDLTGSATAVPEPSTAGLVLVGLLCLAGLAKKAVR